MHYLYSEKVLEEYAVIKITCFSSSIVPCGSEPFNSNTTALYSTRDDYQEYISKTLSTSSQKQRSLFKSLTETYSELNATRNSYRAGEWGYYSFAILVISQSDNTRYNQLLNDFIWSFPTPVKTDGIVVHSVLYFGQETSVTGLALNKIAQLTEGKFFTAQEDLDTVLREITYFL